MTDTIPTRGQSVEKIDASGYQNSSGTGTGFDAIADDPASSTGYAVVYFRGPPNGIFFAHRCK